MIDLINRWIKRIPGPVFLAVGGLLAAAFWLAQHDAHIRQQARLQEARQQTSAEVAALKKQAEQEVEQANVENAKAIERLEGRRRQTEQQNLKLAAQLDALRKQAKVQAEQAATLPIRDVVTRVAAQLGLTSADVERVATAANCSAGGRTCGSSRGNAPSGGDADGSADIAANAMYTPSDARHKTNAVGGNAKPAGEGTGATEQNTGATKMVSAATPPAMALTDSGARKVEAALVDLNACRAESNIEEREGANCQARAQADEAVIERLKGSVAGLNQALQAKDKILSQETAGYKAELKAVRGTFLGRVARVTEHVVVGVALGVAIGMAVR